MAAATLPLVSVDEYLATHFEPDMDFVEGRLEDRCWGEYDHSDLQGELVTRLRAHAAGWNIRAVVETRVQVALGRFRVPDVCVMPLAWQRTQIVTEAPLLCLEVLSPEDRMSRVLARCRDFLAMGVREVWLFDPEERRAYRALPDGSLHPEPESLRLEGTPIVLDLVSLFEVLDR